MGGVGEQRQAVGDQAADDLDDEEGGGQREDELQRALGAGAVEVDAVRVVVARCARAWEPRYPGQGRR